MMKRILIAAFGAALVAAMVPAHARVSQQTLDNLNTAFQGESNAAHRYAAFAKKASEEGNLYAARLFRAASKAETVHRDSHKRTLLKLGGQVKSFELAEVKIGTTAENLQAAFKGECYERDTMYPKFLAQARREGAREAVRTFLHALKAETEHAKLYQEALADPGRKAATPIYVCKVCGFTTLQLPARNCPSCREPVSNYERFD